MESKLVVAMTTEWMRGRHRTGSQSSNVAESVGETDVILLQASPLHHPYWQPVTVNVVSGECGSASSSLCGTPVAQRKSALAQAKGRSPKQRARPSSLVVSDEQSHVVLFEHLTPPASPKHHVAFRSHSSEEDVENDRRSAVASARIRKSNSAMSEVLLESVSPSVMVSPTSSMEKLNRLKDRFMRSMGATTSCSVESKRDVDSDDESTPLVSGITTPTVVENDATTPLFANRGFAGNSNSSSERSSLKPSPVSPLIAEADLLCDDKSVASTYGSSVSLSNILEPASDFSNLFVGSGSASSLASQERVHDKELKVMKKSLSGHFSRQDAVDQAENNKDNSNPETTV